MQIANWKTKRRSSNLQSAICNVHTIPHRRRRNHSSDTSVTNRTKANSRPDANRAPSWSPASSETGVCRQSGQASARDRLGSDPLFDRGKTAEFLESLDPREVSEVAH